jgi:hypothetical protein
MSYRPSARPPVTPWARHLDQVMRDRGWSRVRLFEEVGGELGYSPKSRSGFLPLLEDREPTAAQADVLRRHFGEPQPQEPAPDSAHTEGAGSLAAAILELTAELKAAREAREAYEVRLRAVEAELLSLRAAPVDEASPGRHVPPASAGSGR